jgi:hypothetical protein
VMARVTRFWDIGGLLLGGCPPGVAGAEETGGEGRDAVSERCGRGGRKSD